MMRAKKTDALRRFRSIEGHLGAIEHMGSCVDILHQTDAVRMALETLEVILLGPHLQHCVSEVFPPERPVGSLTSSSSSGRQSPEAAVTRAGEPSQRRWHPVSRQWDTLEKCKKQAREL